MADSVQVSAQDYPLAVSMADRLRTPTGKVVADLTVDSAMSGELDAADLRIAPETLRLQAQIADGAGRPQLASNFRRAAEMTAIPDERVLAMYNALRPRASTKDELFSMAGELDAQWSAPLTAEFVREAAEVYQRRDLLRESEED